MNSKKNTEQQLAESLEGKLPTAPGTEESTIRVDLDRPTLSERQLFIQAIQIEAPAKQIAFLEEACGPNIELVAAVQKLLDAHAADSDCIVDRPLFAESELRPTIVRQKGTVIGPYTLQKMLGEGGMGEVWLAAQLEPVKRNVAIKLVQSDRETPGFLQRFDTERQVLASMNHPNIAQVLDANSTPTGQPFFVMEWIDGQSLSSYCDQASMPIRERLSVFVQIARAVAHAHQKAIIHRDLKPSNVLVTEIDGKPVPKVIDFGLAKALGAQFEVNSIKTQIGAVVGTLEYMAPEQAGYRGQDIDVRADVYSLGVMLYELLTGLRPLSSAINKNMPFDEILRVIKEEEPPRPSVTFSTSAMANSLASMRATTPKQLSTMLRSELDWIVMRAIEKGRDRRYQSANDFADDVDRYLTGLPVLAHPPSRSYRLNKFVRKNKGLVAAILAISCALLLGVVGTAFGLVRANSNAHLYRLEAVKARDAERAALDEKNAADLARNEAVASAKEEQRQREFAEEITKFVKQDILAMLTVQGQYQFYNAEGNGFSNRLGKDATIVDILERAGDRLAARKNLSPAIEAELNHMIGVNFNIVGESKKAIPLLLRARELHRAIPGLETRTQLSTVNSLSVAFFADGQYREASKMLENSLPEATSKLGVTDPLVIQITKNLSTQYASIGDLPQALSISKKLWEACQQKLGKLDVRTIGSQIKYATFLGQMGNFKTSIELLDAALQFQKKEPTLGPDHPETLQTQRMLGTICVENKMIRGVKLLEECRELQIRKFGENSPDELGTSVALGMAYIKTNQVDRAIKTLESTRDRIVRHSTTDSLTFVEVQRSLAKAYKVRKRYPEAIVLLQEVIKFNERKLPLGNGVANSDLQELGYMFWLSGKFDDAIPVFEGILARKRTASKTNGLALAINNLAVNYFDNRQIEKSIPLFKELVEITSNGTGQSRQKTNSIHAEAKRRLRIGYVHTGNVDGFVARAEAELAEMRSNNPANSQQLAKLLIETGTQYGQLKNYSEAEVKLREALKIKQGIPVDEWQTYPLQIAVAESLVKQKKYEQAKRLLETIYQQLQVNKEKLIGNRLQLLALNFLIRCAQDTDNEDELKKWQSEKASLIRPSRK